PSANGTLRPVPVSTYYQRTLTVRVGSQLIVVNCCLTSMFLPRRGVLVRLFAGRKSGRGELVSGRSLHSCATIIRRMLPDFMLRGGIAPMLVAFAGACCLILSACS